jgi:hypothetical protein
LSLVKIRTFYSLLISLASIPSAFGQWTKYYFLYEEADSSFNLDCERLTLFTWDSLGAGAMGSAYINNTIYQGRIKLGFYSQIEKAGGSIRGSSASPQVNRFPTAANNFTPHGDSIWFRTYYHLNDSLDGNHFWA